MKFQIMAGASAAALLFAGAASAQTLGSPPADNYMAPPPAPTANDSSTITQGGTDTSAIVLQSFDGGSSEHNDATVNQIGDGTGNSGDSAYAVVMQIGGTAKAPNSATVNQEGATVTTITYQHGKGNTSNIYQGVNGANSASGNYDGSVAAGTASTLPSAQGVLEAYAANPAVVDQAQFAGADVVQVGTGYTASIDQETNPSSAFIVQNGVGTGSNSYINQAGYGGDNVATSYQSGPYLFSRIIQGGDETAHVDQEGINNYSNVAQTGYDNSSLTYQIGNNDTSTIAQYGGGGSVADVDQESNKDVSSITQDAGGNLNTAKVSQSVSYAASSITQAGTNNNAVVVQGAAASMHF